MEPEPGKCFESWSEELKSRSDRVRRLIGKAHWLSDGHHKEDLVRQFLQRHLAPRLRVTRGFICGSDVELGVSREIDVMVTDSEADIPWFFEGNLIIAPSSAVIAQIHVKTKFDVNELSDVLVSGAHNQAVFEATISGRQLWFGAVFFDSGSARSVEQWKRIWVSAIAKIPKNIRVGSSSFPDCIAIVDGPAFLVDKPANNSTVKQLSIRYFECGKAAPAVFLSHLHESIALPGKDSTRRGDWFRIVSEMTENISKGAFVCNL
jgi:hypothetical protein